MGLFSELLPVFFPVFDAINPLIEITLYGLRRFADLVPS
jgi:hypothetical protein